MPDMLLTFYCAAADRDVLADALRAAVRTPLHLRDEEVVGRDFGDARAIEQVKGVLHRCAIDLMVEESLVDGLVETVGQTRRGHPVRWQVMPVLRQGRIA